MQTPIIDTSTIPSHHAGMNEPASEGISGKRHPQYLWLWVMCLTGVDYFSTLGYQPSIAFETTGLLGPLSTIVLVAMTLFGALPVYAYVAGKSPHGQGSIGMLERLVHGWGGKALILALLGFAATDFVITKTLSAADASKHLISNKAIWPFGPEAISFDRQQMFLTFFLLVLLGAMFLKGFREVIGFAVVIVGVYLVLNLIVVGSGLLYLFNHSEHFDDWYMKVFAGSPSEWHMNEKEMPWKLTVGGPFVLVGVCLLVFPKLALGLSGFETGVAVMSLIRGREDDNPERPAARIRNTRRLLIVAALIMSFYLLGSTLVVSTLVPPSAFEKGADPSALERALAFVAHGEGGTGRICPLFGPVFGTIYDISTVVILWFAGASAMAGLLNLIPRYLPRYGMGPSWANASRSWANASRPLVFLFTAINLGVTWIFRADVSAQGGAYATGVLMLMSSACVATVIDRWRARPRWFWLFRVPWYFSFVAVAFLYTTIAVIIEKPDGIKIAACFIVTIITMSLLSRTARATELRFGGFIFKDEGSRFLWDSIRGAEFDVLVPHRPGQRTLAEKEKTIRKDHRLGENVQIAFIEVELYDPSEFEQQPVLEVKQDGNSVILKITRAASIAHVVAALALELSKVGKPPEIHFGWPEQGVVAGTLSFLLFGEGNVPWMVQQLIRKAQPDPDRQPMVVIGGR
jgi:hypothetical protein